MEIKNLRLWIIHRRRLGILLKNSYFIYLFSKKTTILYITAAITAKTNTLTITFVSLNIWLLYTIK